VTPFDGRYNLLREDADKLIAQAPAREVLVEK